MATPKKLDTFELKDRYTLDSAAILEEAQAAAVRRAEVMGWTEISVRPTGEDVTVHGDFRCYRFELWGVDALSSTLESEQSELNSIENIDSLAARDASL